MARATSLCKLFPYTNSLLEKSPNCGYSCQPFSGPFSICLSVFVYHPHIAATLSSAVFNSSSILCTRSVRLVLFPAIFLFRDDFSIFKYSPSTSSSSFYYILLPDMYSSVPVMFCCLWLLLLSLSVRVNPTHIYSQVHHRLPTLFLSVVSSRNTFYPPPPCYRSCFSPPLHFFTSLSIFKHCTADTYKAVHLFKDISPTNSYMQVIVPYTYPH